MNSHSLMASAAPLGGLSNATLPWITYSTCYRCLVPLA